jgi:hypothetical protein
MEGAVSIFISHVEENRDTAEAISRGLQAAGFNAWSYESNSVPGPTYLSQVMDAIENADAMILLISPEALGSHQVAREIEAAHELDRPIIPVLLGITHEKYLQRRPEWRLALGAFTSIEVPREGVDAIMPKLVGGLEALAVARGEATAKVTVPETRQQRRFEVLRRRPWLAVLLAAVLLAALVAVGAALLSSPGTPKTSAKGTTTSTSTGTRTPSTTATGGPPTSIPDVTQPLDMLKATLQVKPVRAVSTDTLTITYSITNTSNQGFKASKTQMTILLGTSPGGTGTQLSDISRDIAAGATVKDKVYANLADVAARPGSQTVWINIGQRFPGGTVGDVYPAHVAITVTR